MTAPVLPKKASLAPAFHERLHGPEGNPGERIFLGLTGSHAYGIVTETSDEDWRGVFVWPTEKWLRLWDPTDAVQMPGDLTWWEVRHFLRMVAKGSVNANELLWLLPESIADRSPLWDSLVGLRDDFFSSRLWMAWNGVLRGYQHELDKPNRLVGADRRKHLSHVVRFAIGLRHAVSERQIILRLPEAPFLRAIRAGEIEEMEALKHAAFNSQIAADEYEKRPWRKEPLLERTERLLLGDRLARLGMC